MAGLFARFRTRGILDLVLSLGLVSMVTTPRGVLGASPSFPPFFNAASRKPVTSEPTAVTCGENREDKYCQSTSDSQSTRVCAENTCTAVCPHGDTFPRYETFGRLVDPLYLWGSCVRREADFLAPTASQGGCLQFLGSGNDCEVPLQTDWLVNIVFLSQIWQTSFTVWVYNDQGNSEGTLLEAFSSDTSTESVLRISLREEQLKITSGPVNIEDPAWVIPRQRWILLGVQLYNNSLSVFLDGEHIFPAYHNQNLRSNRNALKWVLGKSHLAFDPFVGYLQDFRVYSEVLVNRGMVAEFHNSSIESTRIQRDCLCPDAHPLLKESDPTFCVQNPGPDRSPTESNRLDRHSHPLQFVNDDKENNVWISRSPLDTVALEIELEGVFEVRQVHVLLYSPVPALLTIHRSLENGSWVPWQHLSEDCRRWVGMETDTPLLSEDDVNCRKLVSFDEQYIYSGARVRFDLLEGRPGMDAGIMSLGLRAFLMAGAVKVTLTGHPFTTHAQHMYHGVGEIKLNATCDCNGHGEDCYLLERPYVCQCAAGSYTQGRTCGECLPDSYLTPGRQVAHPDYCQPCACHQPGTVGDNMDCQQMGGQCECKPLAIGRACDTCEDGYFNLTNDNSEGCEACDCDMTGTVNGSQSCDLVSGQCPCKANVEGRRCDVCKPGFSLLAAENDDGCLGCTCNVSGTAPGNESCILETVTCVCKQFAAGRECDQCIQGTYNLNEQNPDGCQPCQCAVGFGSEDIGCDSVTGQCTCRTNVQGKQCDQCVPGYFAYNDSDVMTNGCSHTCDCDVNGTEAGDLAVCQDLGGQCNCQERVSGRRCDQCAEDFYRFGSLSTDVCLACDCDGPGASNVSCDPVSGDCVCKTNVEGPRCDRCKVGYYQLSADNPDGCSPCDCAERGTVSGTVCDPQTGQCQCRGSEGDPQLGGRQCSPYVSDVIPTYGPLSGGTKVYMQTGFMGDISSVSLLLGNMTCPINTTLSNSTFVMCTSSPLGTAMLYENQPIRALWPSSDVTEFAHSFVYMDDPIIDTIAPLSTIVSGGVNLTVTGNFLNSVMFPLMTVTMQYYPASGSVIMETFNSDCTVLDINTMTCPAPELNIPESYLSRSKRSIARSETLRQGRVRRQAEETPPDDLNDEQLTFYLGFILDGVETYRNMSLVNKDYAILRVYKDPKFEMFDSDNNVKSLRKYWPIQEDGILLKGSNLRSGLTPNDYTIVIGQEYCTSLELYENFISCVPPTVKPKPLTDGPSVDDHPQVMVFVGNLQYFVGYLHYETSIWSYLPFRYGIIAGVCVLFLLILLIVICCCCCRKKPPKAAEGQSNDPGTGKSRPLSFISAYETKDGSIKPYMVTSSSDLLSLLPGELRVAIQDLVVEEESLELGKVIGEGHFGKVHLGKFRPGGGTLTPEPVAVKTLKEGGSRTRQETIQFLEEATMMKDFQHTNVLSVSGVVLTATDVRVILPYMENGDLRNFISKEDNMLTVGELIHFGLQISTGMSYLADARFVHRDLACRNCMVNKHLIVKVADFGLSRDIYEQDYYRVGTKKRPLPVKWMAIESLDKGIWTAKSDVWSYGVVLWELLTRGCPPYPDVDVFDVKTFLSRGNRMDRPDYAPDEIYSLMLKCWQEDPERRPTFRQIRDRMSYFLNEVSSHTFTRDKQGQQVPSIAFRGRSYLNRIG